MNQPRIRIACLAALVLVCLASLLTLSGRLRSVQAINFSRDKVQLPATPPATALRFFTPGYEVSNTTSAALVMMQAGCKCTDLVLVVDDTGSLGPAINNVKAGLATIIATATTASGGDLRMGVVS